jgi:ankyrin repeat protein
MGASFRGHTDVVKALLAKGADVNAKSSDGETALIAASVGDHAEIVKMLLARIIHDGRMI